MENKKIREELYVEAVILKRIMIFVFLNMFHQNFQYILYFSFEFTKYILYIFLKMLVACDALGS